MIDNEFKSRYNGIYPLHVDYKIYVTEYSYRCMKWLNQHNRRFSNVCWWEEECKINPSKNVSKIAYGCRDWGVS